MTKTSKAPLGLTRRTFIAGAAVAAASLALPCTSQKAYAWDSYSGITEGWQCDPMHEDMTQIAYVRLVQKTTTAPDPSNVAGTLLYGKDEATYKKNLTYLRQGAFWNDCAANTALEFGLNYFWRYYGIVDYGSYASAFDIAKHVVLTQDNLWWIGPYSYGRALVRFSMNKRGNLLHSMLGVEVDGATYLTQAKQREFVLQWLEAAYKYVAGETLTSEQAHVEKFFDPYAQLNVTKEYSGDADRKMTKRQMKLRAIGMMCHTIEDSYNPAHTVRSYCSPDTSGATIDFGTILAFGNYETQSCHSDYDHIASTDSACADTIMRKECVNGSETLATAKTLQNLDARVSKLYTLGLSLSSEAVHTLLTYLADGKPWAGEVEDWFQNTVFATFFTDQGGSYVYDGGRRAGNIAGLMSAADDSSREVAMRIEKVEDEVAGVIAAYEKLAEYQKELNKFYHRVETSPTLYYHHKDAKVEQDAFASAKAVIDVYTKIFYELATAAERANIKTWQPLARRLLYSAIAGAGGLIQEMSLDLYGVLENTYLKKTTDLLALVSTHNTGEAVGSIEYVTDTHFALNLSNGGTMVCSYSQDTLLLGPNKLVAGAREVKVSYTISNMDMPTAVMTCEAIQIEIPTAEVFYDSKGVVKSIEKNRLVLDIEGSGAVPFMVSSASALDKLAVGNRISIDYAPALHGFIYKGHIVLDQRPLLEQAGTVSRYYGDTFVVVCGEDEEKCGLPIEKAFTYSDADFIGALAVGSEVSVLYYDYDAKQTDLQATYTADGGFLLVPYEASRVAVASNREPLYVHASNGDGTHLKIDADLDVVLAEPCTNENNVCLFCGYEFSNPNPQPDPGPEPAGPSHKEPLAKTGEGAAPWVAAAAAVVAVGSGVAASVAKRFRNTSEQ